MEAVMETKPVSDDVLLMVWLSKMPQPSKQKEKKSN
jgi:hypothetical protein